MAAKTVAELLLSLSTEDRAVIEAVRQAINEKLPKGYEEGIQYGMIGWYVPKSIYPAGYHANPKEPLPFAALGKKKNHYSLYLMCVYGSPSLATWFTTEYEKTGKKLDMGKACVRFKRLEDLPLDLIGRAVARVPVATWIAGHEAVLAGKKTPAKKTGKAPAKASATKKTAHARSSLLGTPSKSTVGGRRDETAHARSSLLGTPSKSTVGGRRDKTTQRVAKPTSRIKKKARRKP